MTTRTLQVLINGALVGTLRDADNIWAFQYDSSWLQTLGAFELAASIPLKEGWQVDGSSVRPVQWFFDNLLPEELMREVLASCSTVALGLRTSTYGKVCAPQSPPISSESHCVKLRAFVALGRIFTRPR